jgi:hypothetical protein
LGFAGRVRPVSTSGRSPNRHGSTFSSAAEELNKLADPEPIARKLPFAPPEQRDQLAQWLPKRFTTCSPNAPEYAYYIAAILRNENTVEPSAKRSAEDVLLIISTPEERKVYNDLARRIQKHFEELEIENSKRRDRRNVQPLTGLMQE